MRLQVLTAVTRHIRHTVFWHVILFCLAGK